MSDKEYAIAVHQCWNSCPAMRNFKVPQELLEMDGPAYWVVIGLRDKGYPPYEAAEVLWELECSLFLISDEDWEMMEAD